MLGFKKVNLKCFRHAISLSALVIIAVGAILYFSGFFKENRDILMFFGFSATSTSILVAVLQSIKVHDWNRRHAAQSDLNAFRDKTKPHAKILNDAFGYYLRDENCPITKDEIHEKICKKNADGKFSRCDKTDKLELNPDKLELTDAIKEYLNLYEGIASGVHQGIYDREVVADLMASNLIKVANLFGPYIAHFNEDMYPSSQGRIWLNIKTLGDDFKRKYRAEKHAVERDKTG
ncbi:DUF4760 domain-containing protein [Oryzomonas sagensis]|uniref:DUF4760 domain-containing protein n=1 Tax=Oryzomonas sagensis TaxID=2603857 RepID=A0ABQ6TNM6_9BACT|nr:DUF4760 domain-containing protein [Oryzomonas sagensis]KAB0670241.1 DUF4760 domain-containing protein [Oryzomonas sagensis]